jgi:hypothetical protein
MTKAASATDVPETVAPPSPPPFIDPANLVVQYAGLAFKTVFVRLPKEFIADDLKRPELWRKVQSRGGKALRKFDQVIAVAYDETWMAEAIVADARNETVVLAKPRITTFPERYEPLFSDENYEVIWVGVGYAVKRKKDGFQMTQPVATTALAERDLRRLYPQRQGA